jgi:hypothetical protein
MLLWKLYVCSGEPLIVPFHLFVKILATRISFSTSELSFLSFSIAAWFSLCASLFNDCLIGSSAYASLSTTAPKLSKGKRSLALLLRSFSQSSVSGICRRVLISTISARAHTGSVMDCHLPLPFSTQARASSNDHCKDEIMRSRNEKFSLHYHMSTSANRLLGRQ